MELQNQFDVAVVIPTTLRSSLTKSIHSIFNQNYKGSIQILVGIDCKMGDKSQLDLLLQQCPKNMAITILDLGYSTSVRHGGVYSNRYSGAIRTILSYAANSKYVAYLDDDDWWRRDHIEKLMNVVVGKAWAFSLRWFVDKNSDWPICKDEWDSLGPGKGINQERFGGFVSPSNLILSKDACHFIFPYWALSPFEDGTGEDRLIFDALLKLNNHASSDAYTCFYAIPSDVQMHEHHKKEFDLRGIQWLYQSSILEQLNFLEAGVKSELKNEKVPSEELLKKLLAINQYSVNALIGYIRLAEINNDIASKNTYLEKLRDLVGPEPFSLSEGVC
jgi:glycosyltransferase involved in cell wall biosynthesis